MTYPMRRRRSIGSSLGDILALEANGAAGGLEHPVDEPQSGSFPRPALPQQDERFAAFHFEIYFVENAAAVDRIADILERKVGQARIPSVLIGAWNSGNLGRREAQHLRRTALLKPHSARVARKCYGKQIIA